MNTPGSGVVARDSVEVPVGVVVVGVGVVVVVVVIVFLVWSPSILSKDVDSLDAFVGADPPSSSPPLWDVTFLLRASRCTGA